MSYLKYPIFAVGMMLAALALYMAIGLAFCAVLATISYWGPPVVIVGAFVVSM